MANKKTLDQLIMEVLNEVKKIDILTSKSNPKEIQDYYKKGMSLSGALEEEVIDEILDATGKGVREIEKIIAALTTPPATPSTTTTPADITKINATPKEITNAIASNQLLFLIKKAFEGVLTPADLYLVAAINEDVSKVEIEDFRKYFEDPKKRGTLPFKKVRQALQRVIALLYKDDAKPAGRANKDRLLKNAEDVKKSMFPFKTDTATKDSGLTELPIEMGINKLSPVAAQAFRGAFSGETTVSGRIERLVELGNAIKDGDMSEISKESTAGEMVSGMLVIDVLGRITRAISSGSAAGWILEGFLGALFGGTDVGAKMGADDFSMEGIFSAEGIVGGSAKLYSSNEHSFGGQAIKKDGFLNLKIGEAIRYIFAERVDSAGRSGASDFETINVYVADVKRINNHFNKDAYNKGIPAERKNLKKIKNEFRLILYPATGGALTMTPTFTESTADKPKIRFKFERNKTNSWGEPHKISIPNVANYPTQFKTALEGVNREIQEMFEMASKLRENMDLYVMDGDFNKGVESVKNYNALQSKMMGAYNKLAIDTGVGYADLTESKTKSIKDLDKLIEQVILEHINK
jgi:hypothetical protein